MAGHPETKMMTATHLAAAPWPPPGSPLLDPARYLGRFFLQHKTQEWINRGVYPDHLKGPADTLLRPQLSLWKHRHSAGIPWG